MNTTNNNKLLFLFLAIILITFFIGNWEGLSIIMTGVAVVIWVPVFLKFSWCLNKQERKYVLVSILFLLLMLFYNYIGLSTNNVVIVVRNISWILSGLISIYVLKMFSKKEQLYLFALFVLLLMMMIVGLMRTGSSYDISEAVNAANTWVSSMLMILSGICIIVANNIKSLYFRVFFIAITFCSIYTNFYILQRGTNAVLTLIEIILIMSLNFKNRFLVKTIFVIVISLTFFLYVTDIYREMFEWIASVIPSERISSRLLIVSRSIQYLDIEEGGGTLTARSELMSISWNTFTSGFQNFVFGAGAHKDDNVIIGNHSFILDTLASYGIIGGIIFYIYFKKQFQFIMSYVNKKANPLLYSQCVVVFCVYIFRNYFGAMATACINFIMLMFFPLAIKMIQKYNTTITKIIKQ